MCVPPFVIKKEPLNTLNLWMKLTTQTKNGRETII